MTNDDGVSLQSAEHPLLITDAMLDAGVTEFWRTGVPGQKIHEQLRAAYTAMVRAAPPAPEDLNEDLNEESLEHALVEIGLHKDTIERFALRCIEAVEGGHKLPAGYLYTEQVMQPWRQFVRELAAEIFDAPRQMRLITDKDDGKAKDD